MAVYIDKMRLAGEVLTISGSQLKFRGMTGVKAYLEFLRMVNHAPVADVEQERHGEWLIKHITVRVFRSHTCGAEMDGGQDAENHD